MRMCSAIRPPVRKGEHRRALVLLDPTHGLAIAETLSWALDGAWLTDAGGQRRARLEHVQDLEGVFELYTGRARTWLTATPLVMHGRDHLRGKLAPRKIAKLVVQALEGSGIPGEVLDDLWFQPAPLWPGAGGARNYRVPAHLASWPRYHVGIRFRLPVSGPLVLGIGRHYGLGLFARADPES